jgi:hypothetical protein
MALAPGAQSPGAAHDAAMDWAADLLRKLDTLTLEEVEWCWADDLDRGPKMREQLKRSAPQVLAQLANAVRDRAAALKVS